MLRRLTAVTLALLALASTLALPASAQDEGALRDRIARGKQQEQTLGSAAEKLGRLAAAMEREVALLDRRLAETQARLDAAETRLAATQVELKAAQDRALRLRKRLAETRVGLATMLRERFQAGRPDLMTVVLDAKGFADLLERFTFLRRVEDADTVIVDIVRDARADARRDRRQLTRLEAAQAETEREVRAERDAVSAMRAARAARAAALAQARRARLEALAHARSSRQAAQRTLDRLLAERARAVAASTGPTGPWAIPWTIVQCESGGQNLPPNTAGASGYYQFMVATWRGLGGSTPQAFQASRAEQDRLAARLWDGGRGADNWVCASLVGAL